MKRLASAFIFILSGCIQETIDNVEASCQQAADDAQAACEEMINNAFVDFWEQIDLAIEDFFLDAGCQRLDNNRFDFDCTGTIMCME